MLSRLLVCVTAASLALAGCTTPYYAITDLLDRSATLPHSRGRETSTEFANHTIMQGRLHYRARENAPSKYVGSRPEAQYKRWS